MLFVNGAAIEELEVKVIYKSILAKIPKYDKNDKNAQELAIRKAFKLSPIYLGDPQPPIPLRRKKRSRSKTKGIVSYYFIHTFMYNSLN